MAGHQNHPSGMWELWVRVLTGMGCYCGVAANLKFNFPNGKLGIYLFSPSLSFEEAYTNDVCMNKKYNEE